MKNLFNENKMVEIFPEGVSKKQFLLTFKCGRFISVIKEVDRLDLYTSDRENLDFDEEGPDVCNASVEHINNVIDSFVFHYGLPNKQQL